MKNYLLTFFICFLTLGQVKALEIPTWATWPKDRIQDEVKLFPFGEEFKYNYFLEKVSQKEGLSIHLQLVQSLQGQDIEAASQMLMDQLRIEDENVILFFLSLSDRQFKISASDDYLLDSEQIDQLVKVTVPSLKSAKYPEALQIFIQNLIIQKNDQSLLSPPPLGKQKRANLHILIFFGSIIVLIFLLGHKLRKSAPVKDFSVGLKKEKSERMGVFW